MESHELFGSMMQDTRLLVLDYDVFRYHSFDLFRHLLMDKKMFMSCDPKVRYIASLVDKSDPISTLQKQIIYYMRNSMNINPYDNFSITRNKYSVTEYENILNDTLPQIKYQTPTAMTHGFVDIFNRNRIVSYILRYRNDTMDIDVPDRVTVYKSDHILDLRMACAIIKEKMINAVILSSSDLAVLLAAKLIQYNITHPISFIIGSYRYNYDPETGVNLNIPEMNALEYHYKHEFGVFDPYTGLSGLRKEMDDNDTH